MWLVLISIAAIEFVEWRSAVDQEEDDEIARMGTACYLAVIKTSNQISPSTITSPIVSAGKMTAATLTHTLARPRLFEGNRHSYPATYSFLMKPYMFLTHTNPMT